MGAVRYMPALSTGMERSPEAMWLAPAVWSTTTKAIIAEQFCHLRDTKHFMDWHSQCEAVMESPVAIYVLPVSVLVCHDDQSHSVTSDTSHTHIHTHRCIHTREHKVHTCVCTCAHAHTSTHVYMCT